MYYYKYRGVGGMSSNDGPDENHIHFLKMLEILGKNAKKRLEILGKKVIYFNWNFYS